jgi:hypothetical protein
LSSIWNSYPHPITCFNIPSGTKPPRLSRDELVTIISDFYTFLTTFYIPACSLKHPPPGGWPNITPETTKGFNKAPYVIDLMKHLPYIDEADAQEMITNIHYKCDVVDCSVFTAEDFASERPHVGENGLEWTIKQQEERKREKEGDADEQWDKEDSQMITTRKEQRVRRRTTTTLNPTGPTTLFRTILS